MVVFAVIVIFSACGDSRADRKKVQDLENRLITAENDLINCQAENNELKNKIENLPKQIFDSLRNVETENRKRLIEVELDNLNLSSMKIFSDDSLKINLHVMDNYFNQYSSGVRVLVAGALWYIKDVFGINDQDVANIRQELSNPVTLIKVYNENKKVIIGIMEIYKIKNGISVSSRKMLPFFKETIDPVLEKKFQEIYKNHGQKDNFNEISFNDDDEKEYYKLWLMVKRRKAEGDKNFGKGKELLNVYVKILQDINS